MGFGAEFIVGGFQVCCLIDEGCDFAELNLGISILYRILNLWGLSNSSNKVRFLLSCVGVSYLHFNPFEKQLMGFGGVLKYGTCISFYSLGFLS